jgi:hypothetical protein
VRASQASVPSWISLNVQKIKIGKTKEIYHALMLKFETVVLNAFCTKYVGQYPKISLNSLNLRFYGNYPPPPGGKVWRNPC